jgi:hypothetical protein
MRKRVKFNQVLRLEGSSMIDTVQYDQDTKVLEVTFNQSSQRQRYRYYDVPVKRFVEVLTAKSQGRAFNNLIKGKYARRKLKTPPTERRFIGLAYRDVPRTDYNAQ